MARWILTEGSAEEVKEIVKPHTSRCETRGQMNGNRSDGSGIYTIFKSVMRKWLEVFVNRFRDVKLPFRKYNAKEITFTPKNLPFDILGYSGPSLFGSND